MFRCPGSAVSEPSPARERRARCPFLVLAAVVLGGCQSDLSTRVIPWSAPGAGALSAPVGGPAAEPG